MKKMLMIVDPQLDFISGTLPVPGAAAAMDALASYVAEHGAEYALIVVTADWHPWRHCSFASEGGIWPRHCVQYSEGAAVWPSVLEAVSECGPSVKVVKKGEAKDVEEYSIFQKPALAERIDGYMADYGISHIDICGIAGDVCVKTTLEQAAARYGSGAVAVMSRFSPSLDGGEALSRTAAQLGVEVKD